jgi:probable rRNA maturation factor
MPSSAARLAPPDAGSRRRPWPGGTPPLALSLQFGSFAGAGVHRAVLKRAAVLRWIGRALERPAEISVRVTGEEEARTLNLRYRGKDYATNVLTFDYAQEPVVMADLVLCGPVVEREAREQGKTVRAHYAHLLVHGTLHAQGYDHETGARDALAMEALEILLMGSLGFRNPY